MTRAELRLRGGADLPESCSGLLTSAGDVSGIVPPAKFSGIVRPPPGALVRYRWRPDGITVTVAAVEGGQTVLIGADEEQCEIPPQDDLNIILPKPWAVDPTWRLPIAGPAAAGGEFGVPVLPGEDGLRDMTFLRAGTVKVFGRSGWPFGERELYAVEPEGFVIPAGSRIGRRCFALALANRAAACECSNSQHHYDHTQDFAHLEILPLVKMKSLFSDSAPRA
jgi:hypothetical protein